MSTPTTPTPRRAKPFRDMLNTTATTISAAMIVARDLVQTIGYEVKSSKMESIVEFKANSKEYAKELEITEAEWLDLINN